MPNRSSYCSDNSPPPKVCRHLSSRRRRFIRYLRATHQIRLKRGSRGTPPPACRMVSGVEDNLMYEDTLQNYCPAFGLLPDLAASAIHPTFGETDPPPAHHWVWRAPPKDVGAIHEPWFVFDIFRRIQAQLNRPVVISHDRAGRRILKVLGCYLFLECCRRPKTEPLGVRTITWTTWR